MSAVHVIPPSPINLIAFGIILPVVSGAIVALRFYCRRLQRAKLLIDDWLVIPAWLFITGMSICVVIGVYRRGLGYPAPAPPPGQNPATFNSPEAIISRQLEYAIELMQFPALTCVKLSFLFFYKRIFCTRSTPILKWILWIMIAVCTLWGFVFFFNFLFVCGTQFTALWGTTKAFKTHCSRILPVNFWVAITDFVFDVIVFFFPIPLIWRLQLSTTRKFGLFTIFAVGALTLAASITRMVIFVEAVKMLTKTYKSSKTNNLTVTAGLYWTTFECGLGLIAACMPTIYVLLKRFSETYLGLKTSQSKKVSLWSWKPAHSRTQQSNHIEVDSASELELVPKDANVATFDTSVSKKDEERYSKHQHERKGDGIMVSKTVSVKRVENMI